MTQPTVTMPREVVQSAMELLIDYQSDCADYEGPEGIEFIEKGIADLRAALDAPAKTLQDSEQYRMQMAGICTAALGYWKPDDSVHPDYDTPALRDVAALYAKYDKLFRAIRKACDELGVPGLGYPAPVTNAVEILKAAIDPFAVDSPAKPITQQMIDAGVAAMYQGAWESDAAEVKNILMAALGAPATVDCRGCKHFYTIKATLLFDHETRQANTSHCSAIPCTDFDKFQALPPIVLTKVTK